MDVLVLCYHGVGDRPLGGLAVTQQRLEAQLRWLLARGYRGVTFSEAVNAPSAPKTLAITFDDAYRSVIERAYPIARRLGIPGSVFVPTDFVGRDGPMTWPGIDHWVGREAASELWPMSWDEIGSLADAGWEIGSHTCSHPRLTELDDVRRASELSDSRGVIEERLRRPCRSFAYPYGDANAAVAEAVRRAGYVAAAALPARLHAPDPLMWPRIGLYEADTGWRFACKVSPAVRHWRATLPGAVAGATARIIWPS